MLPLPTCPCRKLRPYRQLSLSHLAGNANGGDESARSFAEDTSGGGVKVD